MCRTNSELWLLQILQPRLKFTDLAVQAWIDMFPSRSLDRLDWSLTMARGARMAHGALLGSPVVQLYLLPGPCVGRTTDHGL